MPTFTSRTQHTLFISASALLTFELPACWLVPVNWYYDSASHINVDLILHWYLTQHIWMTLCSAAAGNQLNSKVPISGINLWLKKAGTSPNAQSLFYSDGTVLTCLSVHIQCVKVTLINIVSLFFRFVYSFCSHYDMQQGRYLVFICFTSAQH